MRHNKFLKVLKIVLFVAVMATLLTYVVMRLWNWLTPALFGWHVITFWQALGILLLCKILFCGFRGPHGRPDWHWKRRMIERWESMTPEEREKFRASMKGRCGFSEPPAKEQKA